MAFTKVMFDKVYAGTSTNKDYCAWYSNNPNSSPASALGVYTKDGFEACHRADTTFDTTNFSIIKRASNFLVPVLIGIKNNTSDSMIAFTDDRQSDDGQYRIYNFAGPANALSGYDINSDIAASFIVDSLILTNINYTGTNNNIFNSVNFFSIFYNLNTIAVYNSTDNTGIQITSRIENHNTFYRKNIALESLKNTNIFQFYKYNIKFSDRSNTTTTPVLEKYTWPGSNATEQWNNFYNAVKLGTIYVDKASLMDINSFVNPLRHPQYMNGKVKINYYNSTRTTVVTTVEVLMSGNTRENIAFQDFARTNNYLLQYAPLDSTNGFTNIYSVNNETYIGNTSTSSPFYYQGGILVGWTSNKNQYLDNQQSNPNNNIYIPATPDSVTPPFKMGEQVTGKLYNKKFYVNTSSQQAYFYFSNKNNEADLTGLTGPTQIKELKIDLFPVYKKDTGYLPHVVEISPRLRSPAENNTTDTYVSWQKSGVASFFNKVKEFVDEVSGPYKRNANNTYTTWDTSGGPKYLKVHHGNNANTDYIQLGSHIEFPSEISPLPNIQGTGTFRITIDGTTHEIPINGFYSNGTGTSVIIPGPIEISSTHDGVQNTTRNSNNTTTLGNNFTPQGNVAASIYTHGGIYAMNNIYGERIFNAVFNDYAEYRSTINLIPGCVVIDQDDGSLACSSARLQPGAQVISDTYGHCMGATETAQTPIAVAGRVLVYPYQNRNNYHAGMAVCSAPGGTVDIMTREEIRDYPDCIIGIVSEIPEYEEWGSNNVKVDGRIWVRIK